MINCDVHDYIEVACLYKIEVLLTLYSGDEVKGIAITTNINSDKLECLVVELEAERLSIVLDNIQNMQALTPNPYFTYLKIGVDISN